MHVAVLLPGPSLRALERPPTCDVLIGVKRAAVAFTCAWAVALDIPCLKLWDGQFKGDPKLVTREAYRPKYTSRAGTGVEDLQAFCPALDGQWTSSAALALAGILQADAVDVYGADFGTSEDLAEFGGYVSPEANYTVERWARERAAWDRVASWLTGRGVEVRNFHDGLARLHSAG